MTPAIRLRAALAVVQQGKILLVPHFNTDVGPVQWVIPGGAVEFGEYVQAAACREFLEETGYSASIDHLIEVYEIVKPDQPWHSVTFYYQGQISGGQARSEATRWGLRTPRWFSLGELGDAPYHPPAIVRKVLQTSD